MTHLSVFNAFTNCQDPLPYSLAYFWSFIAYTNCQNPFQLPLPFSWNEQGFSVYVHYLSINSCEFTEKHCNLNTYAENIIHFYKADHYQTKMFSLMYYFLWLNYHMLQIIRNISQKLLWIKLVLRIVSITGYLEDWAWQKYRDTNNTRRHRKFIWFFYYSTK